MFLQRPTVADGFDWSLTLPSNLSHKGTPTAPSSDPTIGRQSVGERPVAGSDEGPSIATGLYRILTPRSGGAWGQRGCVGTAGVRGDRARRHIYPGFAIKPNRTQNAKARDRDGTRTEQAVDSSNVLLSK